MKAKMASQKGTWSNEKDDYELGDVIGKLSYVHSYHEFLNHQ